MLVNCNNEAIVPRRCGRLKVSLYVVTDWSFWDEAWFPTAVYATLLLFILIAVARAVLGSTTKNALTALNKDPLLTIGGGVALVGAIGSIWSNEGAPQMAAIVGGLALMVISFVGPRVESVKYRDLEILLAKAERARDQGDEETSQKLYEATLDLLTSARGPGTSGSAPRISRFRLRGDVDRWSDFTSGQSASPSPQTRALEYEHFVAKQLARVLPEDAVFSFPRDRPYDILITRGSRRAAVDVRLGANFRARDFVERLFGDYSLQEPDVRPTYYMLVVNEDPSSSSLEALMRQIASYELPVVLTALGLPMVDENEPDLGELEMAIGPLLG